MMRRVLVCLLLLAPSAQVFAQKPIVAVFEIETQRLRLSGAAKAALSAYLASRLASSGRYAVVPKDKVQQALRAQKKSSYRRCYAQSCQIEIGRELAAQKSLATKIIKIGTQCVVTVALYDLKTATTERGADAKGTCKEGGLMASIEAVVERLGGARTAAATPAPPPAHPRPSGRRAPPPPPVSKDRAPMIYIAAGPFLRGTPTGSYSEKPQRSIYLDAYFIDKHEVTVAQYRRCVQRGLCNDHHLRGIESPGRSAFQASATCNWGQASRQRHPINCLTWHQAAAYCAWAGKRLPTEAEWEKAARGTDGRMYPWGNAEPSCERTVVDTKRLGAGCGRRSTWPVGSKSPAGDSPYGLQDMAGNVAEWVADRWGAIYGTTPSRNPRGPAFGTSRVIRGGSWGGLVHWLPTTRRSSSVTEQDRGDHIGFRCARTP